MSCAIDQYYNKCDNIQTLYLQQHFPVVTVSLYQALLIYHQYEQDLQNKIQILMSISKHQNNEHLIGL